MAVNNNNDHDVMHAIMNELKRVSEEGRERILRAILTFYNMDAPNGSQQLLTEQHTMIPVSQNDRLPNFTDRETISPKEFLHEKQPKTDTERVACLAFYLANYRETPHFKTLDISKLNTEAAQLKFSNTASTVKNAMRSGLLAAAGKGNRQVSAMGERFVDALPDHEGAIAVLNSMRTRRSKKKTSTANKKK